MKEETTIRKNNIRWNEKKEKHRSSIRDSGRDEYGKEREREREGHTEMKKYLSNPKQGKNFKL